MGVNISFPEHNSATVKFILMALGRILEHIITDCRCKNDNCAHFGFLISSPYRCFFLVSGLYLGNHLKYLMMLRWIVELLKAECHMQD